ncbi:MULTISPECIES: hypothetical protein [unclassified Pseudonocardia]|uniref:hypothetical protein n=1 Tax=unclassified Pseudonocardia TaxID=2619320 RepID=UPI00094AC061|nr:MULTISPECIES: hypothetical protein [unclassified Pseudonocardia]
MRRVQQAGGPVQQRGRRLERRLEVGDQRAQVGQQRGELFGDAGQLLGGRAEVLQQRQRLVGDPRDLVQGPLRGPQRRRQLGQRRPQLLALPGGRPRTGGELVDHGADVLLAPGQGVDGAVQVGDQVLDRRTVGADAAQHRANRRERRTGRLHGGVEVLLVPGHGVLQGADEAGQPLPGRLVEGGEHVGDLGRLREVALDHATAGDLGVGRRPVLDEEQALTDDGLPLHVQEGTGVQGARSSSTEISTTACPSSGRTDSIFPAWKPST